MTSATLLKEEQWEMPNVSADIDTDFVETTHHILQTIICDVTRHYENS